MPLPDTTPASIDWLEPQGINIVDLVGQVPDSILAGAIISYTPGYGIVRYESGKREGNIVTITAKIYPRYVVSGGWNGSLFGCLGQPARIDQLGSATQPAIVHLFANGRTVTREVDLYTYVPSGKIKPIRNPRQSEATNQYRYHESEMIPTTFTVDGALIIPPNMGCEFIMSFKNYRELGAVFIIDAPAKTRIQTIKTEQYMFHSYLGPGFRGLLNSLVNQLYAAGYGSRAENVPLNPPAEADYFFVNFPPTPVDPYTAFLDNPHGNLDRPAGGTYRIGIPQGLSVDHVNSMALPLYGHWQDIDQGSGRYLHYSKTPTYLTAPEYFVPPGIPYNPCMLNGGCPRDLLDRIYNATMRVSITYLRVDRVSKDLERIPLHMVGAGYTGAADGPQTEPPRPEEASQAATAAASKRMFLPLLSRHEESTPADTAVGCSSDGGCGWFSPDGRMVDYIPAP
ncbi:MAG: hypothetical protein BWY52_00560 [Chloroflexi bacterium ADurb.Bin325]|nr:MAG: hypothetical protein BWY52_00560 [Chloroflexi bacterium ADurb.Bin325]